MKVRPVLLLATLVLVAACAGEQPPTGMPPVDIPLEVLNTEVRVFYLEGWNTFRIDDPVALSVEVVGDEQVIFPPDFGVRMFLYSEGMWVEIEGVPTEYRGGSFVLSPSHGDPFEVGDTSVFPIVPDKGTPALLRVFVTGHVYRDGKATDERVGAFVDLTLNP